MRCKRINLWYTAEVSSKRRADRTSWTDQVAVSFAFLNKTLCDNIKYAETVTYDWIKFTLKPVCNIFGNRVAVQILSHIPAFFRKFLISAVDMRLKRSRRNRRNIIHNAVGNFFRIINNKFSCSVPCPSEIIKHFTCGFKIKRGLIIRIVKALWSHNDII